MARPGKVDYHVHYYLDSCAGSEMTLPEISREALRMGLEEIVVLKHYSSCLPNGKTDWVAWHTVRQEEFERYLEEMANFSRPEGLMIHTGVETELVNEHGDINIDEDAQARIESIALSVHYMPAMDAIEKPFLYHPRFQKQLLNEEPEAAAEYRRWQEMVRDLTPSYFVERMFAGYEAAIRRYPKICQLSHMFDGLFPMRDYEVPYQQISEKRLIEIMEPTMKAMVEHDVLWELLNEPVGNVNILKRAAEMGVKFVATADGHSMNGSWGRFIDHPLSERYIDALGLPKGTRRF